MAKSKYKILSIIIVFCMGFSLNSVVSIFEREGDVYLQDQPKLLQCTINIDCDNNYDWKIFFSDKKVPEYIRLLDYPEDLKYYEYPR